MQAVVRSFVSISPPACRVLVLAPAGRGLPHLWAGALAVFAAVLALAAFDRLLDRRIDARAARLAELNLPENVRGVALQRRMVRWPDCLMVYGSSELSKFQSTRADRYFRDHPAGFRVVVIGRGGDRCLLMLQELAALGESARGRKFAVFLSPNWFIAPLDQNNRASFQRQFTLDFSPAQASSLLLDGRLDRPLKERIAARLLTHRSVIEQASPVLACTLDAARDDAPWRVGWSAALRPLLALQTDIFCQQDRWRTAQLDPAILPPPTGGALGPGDDPPRATAGPPAPPGADLLHFYPRGDDEFLARLTRSNEWTDLELLLETVRRVGAHVLLVGQPFNAAVYRTCHVSEQARRQYYERIRAVADTHGVALRDFADREDDESFFADLQHPSASAWIAYDQALEQFYHQAN